MEEILSAVNSVVNQVRVSTKNNGRKSLSRLTKDSILQYPLLFSADVPRDMMIDITRGMEKQIASSLIIYLSTNNLVDVDEYEQPSDYIHTFNNTSALPKNLDGLLSITDVITGQEAPAGLGFTGVIESAVAKSADTQSPFSKDTILECWDMTSELINKGSINDLYKGFEVTKRNVAHALEASNPKPSGKKGWKEKYEHEKEKHEKASKLINDLKKENQDLKSPLTEDDVFKAEKAFNRFGSGGSMRSGSWNYKNPPTRAVITKDKSGKTSAYIEGIERPKTDIPKYSTVEDKKMWMLEPTMINCDLILHKAMGSNSFNTVVSLAFGVKCMDRIIPSHIMIDNICDGIKSRGMFKFIQWSRGEIKFIRDIVLGMKRAKKDAAMRNSASDVFASLRRMQRKNAINALLSNGKSGVPPTTTIIITDSEAEQIKQITGVDLRTNQAGARFIYDNFLLAFGILDVENEMLSIMYDAYTDYSLVSIRALKRNNKDDSSIKDFKEMARLFGRI